MGFLHWLIDGGVTGTDYRGRLALMQRERDGPWTVPLAFAIDRGMSGYRETLSAMPSMMPHIQLKVPQS